MKRLILLSLLFSSVILIHAQSISVSSFKLLDTDLTANTAGTMVIDQNGETAALIKVVTTQTGFTFDSGALGIVKTKQTPGEVWVYIPRGSKKISIKHSQLGVLRDYYFPIGIEAAKTYEMILVTGEVQTIVKQTSNSQYLVFKVTPADAVVELDNEILPISDGFAQKFVKLGTYDYRIQAQNYHTAAGKVDIDDPNKKKVIEVTLKPAFGWIEIPANEEFNGAQVFIDNKLEGTIPMKSKDLSSGEHNVKIVKTLYHPFSQTVVIKDNETTKVNPLLSANYSEVTITVENDADIYINEEKKGSGSWSGKLASGSYLLEAKKEGHRSTKQNVDVSSAQPLLNIKLTTPAPIYGEANITSTPTMADVFVDDVLMGQTPLFLPKVLIGNHNVTIKREGYGFYSTIINISENKTIELSSVLNNDEEIDIQDEEVKRICLEKWDFNKDGKFSKKEAEEVVSLERLFSLNRKVENLEVLKYFKQLKRLNDKEFYLCTNLKKIEFPNSLEVIGDSAFAECRNIKDIIIPPSVYHIGSGIITDCSSLRQFDIPASIIRLKSISIPNGTKVVFRGDVSFAISHIFVMPSGLIMVPKKYLKHYKSHPKFKNWKKQINGY